MYDVAGISKYRIFFFETMREAQLSNIGMGNTSSGMTPHLEFYPSKQIRTPTLQKLQISAPEESIAKCCRVLIHIADLHPELTQDNMLFTITQEYSSLKDDSGATIGWLPPSPIQIILPAHFPVSEVQRPHLSVTATAPRNPDPSRIGYGSIPSYGVLDSSGNPVYYTQPNNDGPGILHYTLPTYSRASYVQNHHPTDRLLVCFHPKFPFFVIEPKDIVCLVGGMDNNVLAVSETATDSVHFSIGFGLSTS
jgi:hypothetical protein